MLLSLNKGPHTVLPYETPPQTAYMSIDQSHRPTEEAMPQPFDFSSALED